MGQRDPVNHIQIFMTVLSRILQFKRQMKLSTKRGAKKIIFVERRHDWAAMAPGCRRIGHQYKI